MGCIVQAKLLQTCQALEGKGVGPMSYVGGEETGKDQSATRVFQPRLHSLQCLPLFVNVSCRGILIACQLCAIVMLLLGEKSAFDALLMLS